MAIPNVGSAEAQPPPVMRGFEHINRYWDRTRQAHAAKILPGEYYVTVHSELITTVLGSCISACVRDVKFGVGGMNHFMLPHSDLGDDVWAGTGVNQATRYGSYAMEHMINDILKLGGVRQNLEVKIFGGGKILKRMSDVGQRNIEFIRKYLEREDLHVAAEDVGDIFPRKVVYYPYSGRVLVKRLRSMHNDTIVRREVSYMHALEDEPIAGDVELFD